jgi:hypothetical protein
MVELKVLMVVPGTMLGAQSICSTRCGLTVRECKYGLRFDVQIQSYGVAHHDVKVFEFDH